MQINIKSLNKIQLFMMSIVVYQIGTIIRLQLHLSTIGNSFRILGVGLLLYSIKNEFMFNKFKRFTFSFKFLLTWNIINIMHTIFFGGGLNLTRTFGEDTYILNFFLPFLLFYDVNQFKLKDFTKYALIFASFSLIIIALNYQLLIMANSSYYITSFMDNHDGMASFAQLPVMWAIPSAIIFTNPTLCSKKAVVLSIITFVLAISFSMTFGRRGVSLYGLLFLLFGYFIFLKNKEYSITKKVFTTFLLLILAISVIPFVLGHFSYFFERGLEDSRSAVNEAFYEDMSIGDYIFGRGLNGTYYDPLNIFEEINYQRPGHETGFLNIILHSGLLLLIPYLYICIKSVWLGLFHSKNTWLKSLAVYILLNTIMLFVGSYPSFNLRFFILWVGILFCNSYKYRLMNNDEIKYNLLKK